MPYRVLHLVTSRQRRGAEIFALQLAQNLDASRFESTFCFIHDVDGDGIDTHGFDSHVLHNGDAGQSLLKIIRGTRELTKLAGDFDVVIAHGSSTLLYAGVLKRFVTRPRIAYRNIGMASHWAKNWVVTRFYGMVIRSLDAIVTLGHVTKLDIVNHYRLPPEHVHIIANGVDVSTLTSLEVGTSRQATRSKLGLPDDDFVLINIGSLSPEKNQKVLLDLLSHLRGAGVAASLLVAGSGPLRAYLEEYAQKLRISPHARFLGSRTDIPDLLAASDLLVMPSLTESMPAAVIEAGLVGVPSVASMIGGLPELIVDETTGLLIPLFDDRALCSAVARLAHDPQLRAHMGAMARQVYLQRFDMRNIARQYENLFAEMLARGGGAP